LALGDGGNANDVGLGHISPGGNAQNLSVPLGKMLRFDPLNPALNPSSPDTVSSNGQYRIPASNPFQGSGQVPEVYAYGLRNPYRFSFDPVTGDLIEADVGQNNIEEINRITIGGNYGWAVKEGDFLFNMTNNTVPGQSAGTVGPPLPPPPANFSPGFPAGLIDPISGPKGILEYDHNNGISITGGHGDLNNYSPQTRVSMFPDERNFQIADDANQLRHVVRAQVKYGVDVIKILATGGVLSKGDNPGAPQFTFEELKAAAETAHMAGRKIAAHAHGTEGIKNSILAGIDSIEHASLIDDEGIRLAKEHGTYLVMDIYNDDYILNEAPKVGLPQENIDKEKMVGRLQRENFEKAVKAGVKMAFGTDAGVYPHGDNAKQFYYMVKFGMTPAQAIRAATANAADLVGRAQDVGTIAAGKYADIIAVNADPLADVRALEHVDFVMKGGTIYKDIHQKQ